MNSIDKEIIAGFIIETVDETGEVHWWKTKNGKKLTRKNVTGFLTKKRVWSFGNYLFFHEYGDLVDIRDENYCLLATIGKELADSFRKEPYVKYIN